MADVGGACLTEGPAQRCTSPAKPSTVTSTLSVGFRRLRLASPGPVGGAVDVARAGLAADARPGAPPGGLNRLKLTVDLIFNQSKAEKKKTTKKEGVASCSCSVWLLAGFPLLLYVGVSVRVR